MTQRTSRKHLECLTLRSNALLSAFSVILAGVFVSREFELELELIQTQMSQKPMLQAEVYARALRASQYDTR
jgi:hypothetical protein